MKDGNQRKSRGERLRQRPSKRNGCSAKVTVTLCRQSLRKKVRTIVEGDEGTKEYFVIPCASLHLNTQVCERCDPCMIILSKNLDIISNENKRDAFKNLQLIGLRGRGSLKKTMAFFSNMFPTATLEKCNPK